MAAISIQMYVNFSSGGMGRRWFCCLVGRKWPMVRIDSMVRGMVGSVFLCFMWCFVWAGLVCSRLNAAPVALSCEQGQGLRLGVGSVEHCFGVAYCGGDGQNRLFDCIGTYAVNPALKRKASVADCFTCGG